jgi:hypothetical protein
MIAPTGGKLIPVLIGGQLKWLPADDERHGDAASGGDARLGTTGSDHVVSRRLPPALRQLLAHMRRNRGMLTFFGLVGAIFLLGRATSSRWALLFTIVVGFLLIFLNLDRGPRAAGLSAYSVFNPGFERLPGQLTAGDFAAQIAGRPAPQAELGHQRADFGGRGNRLGGRGDAEPRPPPAQVDNGDDLAGDGREAQEELELQEALRRSQMER